MGTTTTRIFADIARFGDAVALIGEDGGQISYGDLVARADASAIAVGEQKTLVAIEAGNTVPAIIAYVGALRAGHCVLLLKAGAGQDDRIVETFRPSFVMRAGAEAWDRQCDGPVTIIHPDLAVLLSSSGSSGTPKLIRLSHGNLISNALAIVEYLGIDGSERALTTLPFFYSYGMSVIHSHLLAGASLLLDNRSMIDPQLWTRFAAENGTSFAGVPHSFELLERTGFLIDPPAGLRYVTAAGGKLPPDKVEKFATALAARRARLFVMYGQTEASPRIAYLPPAVAATHPAAIGRAIPGGEMWLEDQGGRVVATPHTVGELIYRGPNVMMGYAYHRRDLALGQGSDTLRTGDLATYDEDGLFTITGRLSRFVKLFGLRIDMDDVERWCRDRSPDAVVAGDDAGLVLATLDTADFALGQALSAKLGIPESEVETVAVAAIPRLASGKIDYSAILAMRHAKRVVTAPCGTALASSLADLLRVEAIAPHESFIDAGGDSLSIVAASMLIEERLGHAPPGWERMPMAELERLSQLQHQAANWRPNPGVTPDALARCICILLVVLHHGADIALEGAAIGLLMIAGFYFGRLQVPAVASHGPLVAAFRTLRRIVPLYLAIMAFYFIAKRDLFLPNILFYANLTHGYDDGRTVIGLYWFIETYVWFIICSCLLVSFPVVAKLDRQREILLPLIVLMVSAIAHVMFTPTGHLRAADLRSPFYLYYVFALGWALTFATTDKRKVLLSLLSVATLVLLPAHRVSSGAFVTVSVATLLLWTSRIELSSSGAAKVLALIANSSLYIYLVHPLVFMPLLKLFGEGELMGLPTRIIGAITLTVPISVIAGITLHTRIDHFEGKWRRKRKQPPAIVKIDAAAA